LAPDLAPAIRDHAAWALGNLAADGPEMRVQLVQQGALVALADAFAVLVAGDATAPPPVLDAEHRSLQQSLAFALVNLLRAPPAGHAEALLERWSPATRGALLTALIAATDQLDWAALAELAWLLAYLTGGAKAARGAAA